MSATVTAIVVHHRTPESLSRCLATLADAAGEETLDVLVVDNASGDRSLAAAGQHGDVTVLTNDRNLGFARAVNQGLRASRSPFVLLLNPDTALPPDAVDVLVRFARAQGDRAGVVGPCLLNGDDSVQPSRGSFASLGRTMRDVLRPRARRKYDLSPVNGPVEADWVTGACMLVRRTMLEEVGLLDETYFLYYEDMDLCRRAREAGWSVWFCPEVQVHHFHPHALQTQRPRCVPVEIRRSHRIYYRRHHGLAGRTALWALTLAFGSALTAAGLVLPRRSPRTGLAILRDLFLPLGGRVYSGEGERIEVGRGRPASEPEM